MSKHQSCRSCGYDFVGPDLNIGQNLCDECDEEIHADCNAEIARLKAENERLVKALEPFALMHRDDCDLNEIALTRGTASDMTVLCSRDFKKAKELLSK